MGVKGGALPAVAVEGSGELGSELGGAAVALGTAVFAAVVGAADGAVERGTVNELLGVPNGSGNSGNGSKRHCGELVAELAGCVGDCGAGCDEVTGRGAEVPGVDGDGGALGEGRGTLGGET